MAVSWTCISESSNPGLTCKLRLRPLLALRSYYVGSVGATALLFLFDNRNHNYYCASGRTGSRHLACPDRRACPKCSWDKAYFAVNLLKHGSGFANIKSCPVARFWLLFIVTEAVDGPQRRDARVRIFQAFVRGQLLDLSAHDLKHDARFPPLTLGILVTAGVP